MTKKELKIVREFKYGLCMETLGVIYFPGTPYGPKKVEEIIRRFMVSQNKTVDFHKMKK